MLVLAVSILSGGTTAVVYLLALIAFVVAAVVAWPVKYATAIAVGLALVTFVSFWNAWAVA